MLGEDNRSKYNKYLNGMQDKIEKDLDDGTISETEAANDMANILSYDEWLETCEEHSKY